MPYNFKNLVFEGGGVKGIAYVGALDVLIEKEILKDIERVGGTSAGAINAILVGLGFSQEETKDILWSLDFKKIMDDSWGVVRDVKRLIDTILNAQQNTHLHSDDWARTVYIDTLGVNTTDFNLKDDKKQALVDSGSQGTQEYFNWFDNEPAALNK